MKDRTEFTKTITQLLLFMILEGETPIIDYVKRHDKTQKILFDEGKSKCDGVNKVSRHQRGMAMDIYFLEDSRLVPPHKGFDYWHRRWEEMGGEPAIEWDQGHFEG